ncbi:MAG: peptide chain release factor N(5)-glutamine methyltransferase [Gammaproteobacteria bacterium]|nr:peptide chain release factor N(5)-glutamine methyltransferase [Gammaproteobacteria bacterium]
MTLPTIDAALHWANGQLTASDSPRLDGQVLLCHQLQRPRSYLFAYGDRLLSASDWQGFQQLVAARADGQPVAYLVGEREFWSLPLKVSDATLIPRPDTEVLVAHALSLSLAAQSRVADLGTGSGAIALALASERPLWQLWASDRSPEALAVAEANAVRLALTNVQFCCGDWYQPLPAAALPLQLIISNPPYLAAVDPHLGEGDLRFEPATALVAGDDGLADLRLLIEQAYRYLEPAGYLLLEHGATQGPAVAALMAMAGFSAEPVLDLAGHWRASCGRLTLR